MRKRVKLMTVLIMAAALVVCALLWMNELDGDIAAMQGNVKQSELDLRLAQREESEITQEVANMNRDSYIIAKARELGFLMPGEIRFVVTNPEVLMENPQDAQVEELKDE